MSQISIALARKYRPKTFSDLVGQDLMVQALTQGLTMTRVPQCLIFSGVRGVGKTTLARLYSKALCCEKAPTPEPCGLCSHCQAIDLGSHPDLFEVDAASHNSVDDIRAIQEGILYTPQKGAYRIYLLDEVHMLSISAFNALLKTLEEPPPHVIFIFATTELEKIPETILGRCQVFHLKKISTEKIIYRLEQVLKNEKIPFEPNSLIPIAKQAGGSLRDALTLLDQAVSLGLGSITEKISESLCQTLSPSSVFSYFLALIKSDGQECLDLLDHWDQEGKHLNGFLEELLRLIRGALIYSRGYHSGLDYSEDIVNQLKELSIPPKKLHQIFREFMACLKDLDGSNQDRWLIENTTLEWCCDKENIMKQQQQEIKKEIIQEKPKPAEEQQEQTPQQKSYREALGRLIQKVKEHKPLAAKLLEDVYPIKISGQELVICVKPDSVSSKLLEPQEQKNMSLILEQAVGYKGQLVVVLAQNEEHTQGETLSEIRQREQQEKIEKDQKDLMEKPLVKTLLEELGATIKKETKK